MTAPRLVTLALLALLLMAQAGLWLGDAGLPRVAVLRAQLDQQLARNAAMVATNQRMAAEVDDLRTGLEMIEDRARRDLGLIKPDEIFVQVAPRR
ncbi:MAG: septum formation initiator family protein [Aquabacterium sp.]